METVWIIAAICWGFVWGACTRQNVIDKGYENGFAYFVLGFFLGFIGFIIAYVKPDLKKEEQERMMRDIYYRTQAADKARQQPIQADNNWRCSCGAMNRPDEAVCHRCGTAKEKPKQNTSNQSAEKVGDELKKYKEMLDQGLITQEDFDAKKKQLLGL